MGGSIRNQLEAEMLIYERGRGATTIITTNSKNRSTIGSYFATVKKALKSGDDTESNRFRISRLLILLVSLTPSKRIWIYFTTLRTARKSLNLWRFIKIEGEANE